MQIKLVKRAQKGDKEAFEIIIMEVLEEMYKVAYKILKNEENSSDAVSNAVLKAFEKIVYLREAEYFNTWIIKILINEANLILRKNKKIIYIDEYTKVQEKSCYSEDKETKIDVENVINNMEDELKNIVILYYYNDMSVSQISYILDIAEGTVKSRLSRARKKIAEKLSYKYIEE